jgi:hypothetical protein
MKKKMIRKDKTAFFCKDLPDNHAGLRQHAAILTKNRRGTQARVTKHGRTSLKYDRY